MRTGAAVVRSGEKPEFIGLVLEFVNGKSMDDICRGSQVLHIHVLRAMLLQVTIDSYHLSSSLACFCAMWWHTRIDSIETVGSSWTHCNKGVGDMTGAGLMLMTLIRAGLPDLGGWSANMWLPALGLGDIQCHGSQAAT